MLIRDLSTQIVCYTLQLIIYKAYIAYKAHNYLNHVKARQKHAISPIIPRMCGPSSPFIVFKFSKSQQAFFNPFRLAKEGGIDPILRGLIFTGSKERRIEENGPFNQDLLEKLFQASDAIALDLGALNVQRSRDHGIPFYPEWRRYCGLSVPQTFEDLREDFNPSAIRKLRELYSNVRRKMT